MQTLKYNIWNINYNIVLTEAGSVNKVKVKFNNIFVIYRTFKNCMLFNKNNSYWEKKIL